MIERLRATRAAGSPAVLAGVLGITVAAECFLVAVPHIGVLPSIGAVVVAVGAWGLVVTDPHLESHPRWALTAIAVAFVVAFAMPPRGSHDLWSYVMYGRILAIHHASPYVAPPSAYRRDPFLRMVASGWRGTRSVYGPLFTGASGLLARLDPRSLLASRLAFQALASVGVVASLGIVWFESKSVRALCFVGLHPAIVLALVNGGHNDGLVGAAVIAGIVLARRRRPATAGVAIGLGMLVKASTAFGALGIAVWLLARRRHDFARFAVAASLVTVVGYLPAGTAAVKSVAESANRTTRARSVWSPISLLVHGPVGGPALVAAVILATAGAVRFRAAATPALGAVAACAAYLIAGPYVLPWYPAWALPAAALTRRSVLAPIVAGHAAFLVLVYELPRRTSGTLGAAARGVAVTGTAIVFLGLLASAIAIASGGGFASSPAAPVTTEKKQ